MKVLIIGGNRFFGRRLAKTLLERGDQVTLLNRGQLADGLGPQVKRITLDRRQLKKDHPALGTQEWDVVYDQVCYDADEALGACQTFQGRVRKFIFTSTQSVYRPGQNIRETTFDSKSYRFEKTVDRNVYYGESKRQSEATFFQTAKFPVTSVRFPIVLGEDDYTERLLFHIRHAKSQTPVYFPDIKSRMSFVHAQDAADFLAFLATHALNEPVNCCSDEPISIEHTMQAIQMVVGKAVLAADQAGSGEPSPFGIESDWFMNTEKMSALGFRAASVDQWLPGIIVKLAVVA